MFPDKIMINLPPVMKRLIILLLTFTFSNALAQVHKGLTYKELQATQKQIYTKLGRYPEMFMTWRTQSEKKVQLEKVACSEGRVNLTFNDAIIQIPIREELCKLWEQMVRDTLGSKYKDAAIGLFYSGMPIERYIPNLFRQTIAPDPKRTAKPVQSIPLVKSTGNPLYTRGLSNRNIALWPSHGQYFEWDDSTWKFQRPPLFCTVEDLHTFYYCDQYLIPMLENAGAYIISPRERDTQTDQIIIDNDRSSAGAQLILSKGWTTIAGGYKHIDTLVTQNPFFEGSYMKSPTDGGMATYIAPIKKQGDYAVYVSYKPLNINSTKALYTVEHMGGKSTFEVNQTIGGGWVYLGKFTFAGSAKIILAGKGNITADAVRLGGGMGNVKRLTSTSSMPRWAEAARYYMQFSGVPQLIYQQEHTSKAVSDYMDDYKSRGDWVNYIISSQKVPIDLTLALHSNAGITDSTFGTLTIAYTDKGRRTYADGKSAFAGRDLADIVQNQIVEDLRAKFDPAWAKRSIYDKSYAEISRPNTPALIIEMFSHQNFNDMKLALDPEFRFTMARAIYKGVLKFLADRYNTSYMVQPLPVDSVTIDLQNQNLAITWRPTIDTLEPSALAQRYKLYTRIGNSAFDNGVVASREKILLPVKNDGLVRTYKITAENDGGESFPTSQFATCLFPSSDPVLIINDLPAASAPDTTNRENMRGFDLLASKSLTEDYSIVGVQKDYDPESLFVDNENPGWGASDFSLLFKGLHNQTRPVILQLIQQLADKKQSFIQTSPNTLYKLSYKPIAVYIISDKSEDEINKQYKTQFAPNTRITILNFNNKK